jgi:hypothetical protein
VFEFRSETECFKVTVKIQQRCIIYTNTDIYTLLCFNGNLKKFCFTFE